MINCIVDICNNKKIFKTIFLWGISIPNKTMLLHGIIFRCSVFNFFFFCCFLFIFIHIHGDIFFCVFLSVCSGCFIVFFLLLLILFGIFDQRLQTKKKNKQKKFNQRSKEQRKKQQRYKPNEKVKSKKYS